MLLFFMQLKLRNQLSVAVYAFMFLLVPIIVLGRVGVGVGTGKIVVDQPLKPGLIYTLPSLSVLNTGDEPGEYGVSVEYQEYVPQLRPDRGWFHFEPQSFHLEPGSVQAVKVTLTLPTKTKPGDYFAYLEGHPAKKDVAGQTSIGIAAAAKLYFTVAPANIFQGIYYRITSFLSRYAPWTFVILAVIVAAILILLFRRFFNFKIGVSLRNKR